MERLRASLAGKEVASEPSRRRTASKAKAPRKTSKRPEGRVA
jgi:hypothetical protein